MNKKRLLVADNRDIFREGLVKILDEAENLQLVGLCSVYKDIIQRVTDLKPDVILLNTEIPGINPVELAQDIKGIVPEARILFLIPPPPPSPDKRIPPLVALRAGVNGIINADVSSLSLIDSIVRVCEGEMVLPPTLGGSVLEEYYLSSEGRERVQQVNLSRREQEVLALVVRGLTTREISDTMFITQFTVKVHLNNIFKKLGVKNRLQAAVLATEMQLTPGGSPHLPPRK